MEKIDIEINGYSLADLGLIASEGTINALLLPANPKKIVYNDNNTIHGSVALTSNRKIDKREISLPFFLASQTDTLSGINVVLENLQTLLLAGKNNTGVNELEFNNINRKFQLVYNGFSKYSTFNYSGKANVTIKFVELKPFDRDAID